MVRNLKDRSRYQVMALRALAQERGALEALLFPNRLVVLRLLAAFVFGYSRMLALSIRCGQSHTSL